jgi:acetyl esterase/lipase
VLVSIYLLLSILLLSNTIGVVSPRYYGSTFGILGAVPFIITAMMAPQIVLIGWLFTAVVIATGGLSSLAGQVGLVLHLISWGLFAKHFIDMQSAYPVLDGRVILDTESAFPQKATGPKPTISYWPYLSYRTKARAAVTVQRSIVYCEIDGVRLHLDVYRPQRTVPLSGSRAGPQTLGPSIIYIHGGAWVVGGRRQSPFMMFELAAAGYVVFAIQYRLAPRFPLPAAISDCKAAVAWVREHAGQYGGTSDAVVIGGSAGGHLAAMTALSSQEKHFQPGFESADTRVRGAICLYGFYDFISRLESPEKTGLWQRLIPWHQWFFESVVFATRFREKPDIFRAAQPSSYVSPQAPPMLLIHGVNDSLVPISDSRRLHEQLTSQGVLAHICEVPLAQHAFEIVPSPLHQRTMRIILEFLNTLPSRNTV